MRLHYPTTAWIMQHSETPPAKAAAFDITPLADVMARLRAPDGCPWDREQDHVSLLPYLLEESHEFFEAAERGDSAAMREELGDVLLQVVFHAQIAAERGDFNLQDVIDGITDKMRRRHPHVFGDETVTTADEQTQRWQALKRAEGRGTLDGVPAQLPALARAQRLSEKAAVVGFDWPNVDDVLAKLREEVGELRAELPAGRLERLRDETGDVLFVVVNLARKIGVDAERALHQASRKFVRRFTRVESLLAERGFTPEQSPLEQMEQMWNRAKELERPTEESP